MDFFLLHLILRVNKFYFTIFILDSLRTAHEYFRYFVSSHIYDIKMIFLLLDILNCGFLSL